MAFRHPWRLGLGIRGALGRVRALGVWSLPRLPCQHTLPCIVCTSRHDAGRAPAGAQAPHRRVPAPPAARHAASNLQSLLLLQGGIYHGRILMPAEYPFKPPAFVMLTPSGRFETGVKIWCVAAAAAARLANACIACGPSRTHFGMARQGL